MTDTVLFKNAFVYTGTGVLRNAIPFLLLPVLTRYLVPSDIGIVAIFEAVLAVTFVCVNLNTHGAVSVNFFMLRPAELNNYAGNTVLISFAASVATLVIAYVVLSLAGFSDAAMLRTWAAPVILSALATSLFNLVLTLWQVEQRPFPYGFFQIGQTSLNVSLSLLLVVGLGWGWQGRVGAIVAANALFGLLSLYVLAVRRKISFRIHRPYVKDALWFGLPLLPHSLGVWILAAADRLLLGALLTAAATGVYSVGYQIGMIVGLIATSFNQAWSPVLFDKLRDSSHNTRLRIVKFTYAYCACLIAFAFMISALAPPFMAFFVGPAFADAHQYVFWVATGYAANGMYFMVANYIFWVKKTHLLAWVTFTAAAINVTLNYFWIPQRGALGAAQATTVSFVVTFLLTWALSARVYRMPWLFWMNPTDLAEDVGARAPTTP